MQPIKIIPKERNSPKGVTAAVYATDVHVSYGKVFIPARIIIPPIVIPLGCHR